MEPNEDYKVLEAAIKRCDEALNMNYRPNTSDQRTVLDAAWKYLGLLE